MKLDQYCLDLEFKVTLSTIKCGTEVVYLFRNTLDSLDEAFIKVACNMTSYRPIAYKPRSRCDFVFILYDYWVGKYGGNVG